MEIKELRANPEGEGSDEEEASEEEAVEYGSEEEEEEKQTPVITTPVVNAKGKKKKIKGGAFAVNTSYCRSELELLQHVIYKNSF